jgi:O-acetylhomoserine/O-acetylserine sulfhydrylase
MPLLTVNVSVLLKKFGIGVKFVQGLNTEAFASAIDEKTKAIYVESIGNPKYNVSDIPALSKVSHCSKSVASAL